MRLLVINPNTSAPATERIGSIASRAASAGTRISVVSARSGIPLIQSMEQSERAAAAVVGLIAEEQAAFDAFVIAAFTDPGLERVAAALGKPVVGIAQAAMLDAAAEGRRFAVVTLGASLIEPLRGLAARYGVADRLAPIRVLPAPFSDVAYDPDRYADLFGQACRAAIEEDDVDAIVIGGGPLAGMAELIGPQLSVPLYDGVVCAVRRAERLLLAAKALDRG